VVKFAWRKECGRKVFWEKRVWEKGWGEKSGRSWKSAGSEKNVSIEIVIYSSHYIRITLYTHHT
jgi:hypothetical protein